MPVRNGKSVFISSTAIDLPAHREKVIQACLELGYQPCGMEHWPAADASALEFCLAQVDAADVFIGIYAHRYGWVPPGQTKSITELEYDRAVERDIPRLLFVMGEDHPIRARDKDSDGGPINAFKQRIETERVRATFDNADQLRAEVLHALKSTVLPNDDALRVDLAHLPAGAPHFLGRTDELAALDAAWESSGQTAIVELIAPGGTGKTALAKQWVERLKTAGWRGAQWVFAWSFYSQGTSDDRQASEDHFLAQALEWFGVAIEANRSAEDKGHALAQAVAARRTLLVLDGLEPLQYPPGPLAGELRAPGVKALLTQLAAAGQPGLCLLTSREWLKDLDEWVRTPEVPKRPVLRIDLGNLDPADGARLLHRSGVNRAGEAAIAEDDEELRTASSEVAGHALTLALLGLYLKRAHHGDIRRRDRVELAQASAKAGGHAFRVIAAYEHWLTQGGPESAVELAILRLLGFFDRSASRESLAALTAAPAIPGLTEALQDLSVNDWNTALANLQENRLLAYDPSSGSLDAHPLMREYFATALEKNQPKAWREGHRRIYEQLEASVPHQPDDLAELHPLFQAVSHGCRAGLYQAACGEVYYGRIRRGEEAYSTKKLGAFGANLGAVACFFVDPWRRLAPALSEGDQAWLLSEAAFSLRALGRLEEALEPMRAGAEMQVQQKVWTSAAITFSNLSQLQLSLGRVVEAVADAERAVTYADHSGEAFQCLARRADLADARHQQGETEDAAAGFVEAEAMQANLQPAVPRFYSLRAFQYCDLLLAAAERAAWRGQPAPEEGESLVAACAAATERAAQTLEWVEANNLSLLTIALHHLILARCTLYTDRLQGHAPGTTAQRETAAAVDGLHKAASMDHIPRGLLTRAHLRHARGDLPGAEADLNEAHRIASRGGMKLHLADIALTRARLFKDRNELAKARKLIEECGYGRRIPELKDAEERAEKEGWA